MSKKIRLGFVGTGMMGRNHIEAIQKHFSAEAEVAAICDDNAGELGRAEKMAPEAELFPRWSDLLNESLAGVIISTPNFTHAEIAAAALKSGKDVLSEKPVATTSEDCYKMVAAAGKSKKTLMIGHELRYSQYFSKIKEIIDSGIIGNPHLIWCKEFRGRFLPKIDNWIQNKLYSGGALVDKNNHHFDLMNWYLDRKPRAVSAFGGNDVVKVIKNENEIEDNATVIVNYEGKARAALLLCMFAPIAFPEPLELGVFGDRGYLGTIISRNEIVVIQRENPEDVREVERRFEFRKKDNDVIAYVVASPKNDYGGHSGFIEEHRAFLDAIKTGRKPLTSIEKCLYGTLIPIAAEKAMETGKVVNL